MNEEKIAGHEGIRLRTVKEEAAGFPIKLVASIELPVDVKTRNLASGTLSVWVKKVGKEDKVS